MHDILNRGPTDADVRFNLLLSWFLCLGFYKLVCARDFHMDPDVAQINNNREGSFDLSTWMTTFRPVHPKLSNRMYFL